MHVLFAAISDFVFSHEIIDHSTSVCAFHVSSPLKSDDISYIIMIPHCENL